MQLYNEISIIDIVQKYYSGEIKKGYISCICHDEKTSSMKIGGKKNIAYCFGCGIRLDPIDFIQKLFNIGFKEAIDLLKKDFFIHENMNYKHKKEKSTKEKLNKFIEIETDKFNKIFKLSYMQDNKTLKLINIMSEEVCNKLMNFEFDSYIEKIGYIIESKRKINYIMNNYGDFNGKYRQVFKL